MLVTIFLLFLSVSLFFCCVRLYSLSVHALGEIKWQIKAKDCLRYTKINKICNKIIYKRIKMRLKNVTVRDG